MRCHHLCPVHGHAGRDESATRKTTLITAFALETCQINQTKRSRSSAAAPADRARRSSGAISFAPPQDTSPSAVTVVTERKLYPLAVGQVPGYLLIDDDGVPQHVHTFGFISTAPNLS